MSVETSNEQAKLNNYSERCDGCYSARAQRKVVKGEQEFYFCLHHYDINESKLVEQGWMLVDEVPVAVIEKEPALV